MTQKNFARRYIEKIFLFGLHIYFTPPILLLKKVFFFFFFVGEVCMVQLSGTKRNIRGKSHMGKWV